MLFVMFIFFVVIAFLFFFGPSVVALLGAAMFIFATHSAIHLVAENKKLYFVVDLALNVLILFYLKLCVGPAAILPIAFLILDVNLAAFCLKVGAFLFEKIASLFSIPTSFSSNVLVKWVGFILTRMIFIFCLVIFFMTGYSAFVMFGKIASFGFLIIVQCVTAFGFGFILKLFLTFSLSSALHTTWSGISFLGRECKRIIAGATSIIAQTDVKGIFTTIFEAIKEQLNRISS